VIDSDIYVNHTDFASCACWSKATPKAKAKKILMDMDMELTFQGPYAARNIALLRKPQCMQSRFSLHVELKGPLQTWLKALCG